MKNAHPMECEVRYATRNLVLGNLCDCCPVWIVVELRSSGSRATKPVVPQGWCLSCPVDIGWDAWLRSVRIGGEVMLILLLVLIILFGGGGFYAGGNYAWGGGGLGLILVIILIVMLVGGRL